jgi:AcrR family transcriptional regulator
MPHQPPNPTTGNRIVEATLTLIDESGLGGATMSKIAETAGVSRQTLYNHYPNADSIVAEAIRQHNLLAIGLLERTMTVVHVPEERLEHLVRHVVSLAADHSRHVSALQRGLPAELRPTLDDYNEAIAGHLRAILRDGKRTGVFRNDLTPSIDAHLTQRLLDGLADLAAQRPHKAAHIAETGIRTIRAAVGQRQRRHRPATRDGTTTP